MDSPTRWSPARHEFEYPDIAGYPDGTGTLDQGTAHAVAADSVIIAELEAFMHGDERAS
jgi:hypothetical protein